MLIPQIYIKSTRNILIKFQSKIASINATILDQKKFLLLPIILFTSDSKIKIGYKDKLLNLLNNNWDAFTLGFLPTKKINNKVKTTGESVTSALKLCRLGNLSKAVKNLSSSNTERISGTTDSTAKLRLKHPLAGPCNLTQSQLESFPSFPLANIEAIDPDDDIRASDENIEKFLRKAIAGTTHNFDHFRVEHLKKGGS